MFKSIKTRLSTFARDADGNMTVEAVIFIPFILSVLMATFALYDGFRYKTLNTKAAYTISDALSRETGAITPQYLDGMVSTLKFLTRSEQLYSLRVTTVQFDEGNNRYVVKWSKGRGIFSSLQNADLTALTTKLPKMLDNETIIVVETHTTYQTPFAVDEILTDDLFYNFTFTRPRFAPQLVWSDGPSNAGST